MARTAQLGLPLVLPAQAQKHVTVNEALARLDAVAQLRVIASDLAAPPAATDGASFLVPSGASGDWAGQAGRIAVFANGGWVFLTPKAGWQAWDEGRGRAMLFNGTEWVPDAVVAAAGGSATLRKLIEFDHAVAAGATSATTQTIPANAQVIGVTGRVIEEITGAGVTAWRLGVAAASSRYGTGLGIGRNSYALGLTGAPVTYYADTPLLLTAQGGSFAGGAVRLAIHYATVLPPREV